jgi:hypothetical protein
MLSADVAEEEGGGASKHRPFHRELDVQSSSRLVSGHAQYTSRVDEQLFIMKELLVEIHGSEQIDTNDTEKWIHVTNQVRIHLNTDHFDKAAAHVSDASDELNRMHIMVESHRYSNRRSTYRNALLSVEHHLEAAIANLETYVEKKGGRKAGPMLCSATVLDILHRSEEALLAPTVEQSQVVHLHHNLEKLRQKYLRAAQGQKGTFGPLLTRLDDINEEAANAEQTHDPATYAHLAHSIRDLRHVVLDYRRAGMFALSDERCEEHIDASAKTLEFFENQSAPAPHSEPRGRDPAAHAAEADDDLIGGETDKPADMLDMSIRDVVNAFVAAWRTIGHDVSKALHAMRNSSETDVRALLAAFFGDVFRTMIKLEHMPHVGIGLMVLSIVVYMLLAS